MLLGLQDMGLFPYKMTVFTVFVIICNCATIAPARPYK